MLPQKTGSVPLLDKYIRKAACKKGCENYCGSRLVSVAGNVGRGMLKWQRMCRIRIFCDIYKTVGGEMLDTNWKMFTVFMDLERCFR